MGAKTWTPGEPPEHLTEMINQNAKNLQNPEARKDISNCIQIGDIKTKFVENSLRVAAVLKNSCNKMVSYFSKFQLLGADNFPLAQEVQNSHTQIAAHDSKTELGIFTQTLEAPPAVLVFQITSFDTYAYGTVTKRDPLTLTFPEGYFSTGTPHKKLPATAYSGDCFHVDTIKAKFVATADAPFYFGTEHMPGKNPVSLSVIIQIANTCDDKRSEPNSAPLIDTPGLNQLEMTYYFTDKDSFAVTNEQSLGRGYAVEGNEISQRAVLQVPDKIYENKANYAVIFKIHRGSAPAQEASIPLAKIGSGE